MPKIAYLEIHEGILIGIKQLMYSYYLAVKWTDRGKTCKCNMP